MTGMTVDVDDICDLFCAHALLDWRAQQSSEGRESSVVKVNPEDYESLGKEKIALESSVKVISLGDSAVGKSK